MMPGTDRTIDPLTGDYTLDSATGNYETTTGARTAIYHALKCHREKWAADAEFGSRIYQLARGKSMPRTQRVLSDMVSEALADLIKDGRILKPTILTERTAERIVIEATTTDLETGDEIVLTDLLPFQV